MMMMMTTTMMMMETCVAGVNERVGGSGSYDDGGDV